MRHECCATVYCRLFQCSRHHTDEAENKRFVVIKKKKKVNASKVNNWMATLFRVVLSLGGNIKKQVVTLGGRCDLSLRFLPQSSALSWTAHFPQVWMSARKRLLLSASSTRFVPMHEQWLAQVWKIYLLCMALFLYSYILSSSPLCGNISFDSCCTSIFLTFQPDPSCHLLQG